jgi:O-antigen/teichoic acid export membrane protein
MGNSRLKNSALNLATGLLGRLLTIILNFAVRTIFIHCLDEAYLSVNGLYSNILTVLSLAELGFGSAMVYHMYEPMAKKNYQKVAELLYFYKKAYFAVGMAIVGIGVCIIPFMDVIIKDKPDVPWLTLYYIIFLLNSGLSYCFAACKGTLFLADQKEYVQTNARNTIAIIQTALQVLLLLLFRAYLSYLLIQLAGTLCVNAYVAHLAEKRYPEISKYKNDRLNGDEKRQLLKDTGALFLTKVGHVALNGTDNIIISAVVGVLWVGRLSNYTLICDSVTSVLCQITAAITGSLGNFFATEDKHAGYALFKKVEFLNFWLYGFSFIALLILLDPFIRLWAGARFVLGLPVCFAIALNFFVAGYMNTLWVFRSTLGLFKQGKYRPLIVAGLNIVLSIALGKIWGVFGVLFATFLSRAAVNLWYDPIVLHKYGFGVSAKPFFCEYAKRLLLVASLSILLLAVRKFVFLTGVSILGFVIMMVITAIVPNAMFWIAYHKKNEYLYFEDILKNRIIAPLKKKLH